MGANNHSRPRAQPLTGGKRQTHAHEGEAAWPVLASIVENSDDAIISKRLDGTILGWNHGATRLLGYRRSEMIGRPIFQIIPAARVEEERRTLRRLRRGEHIHHYETVRRCKDGRLIDISLSASPIRDDKGRVVGAAKILRDITARKRMEAELRNSERLMRAILDTAADVIITIDQHGIIQSVNAAARRLFGYSAGELVGENVSRLMPKPFRDEHDRYIADYLKSGRAKVIGIGREVTGVKKDGSTFPLHLALGEARLGEQRLFTGIIHDLSRRRFLERQILEAAANEQRRIGRDLHDGLCQDLIGIAFAIDNASRRLPQDCQNEADFLNRIAASVRVAVGQARDLSHGLNPVDLHAGGLAAALESLASRVGESFGVRCSFNRDAAARVPDDVSATHLYRIAQEAINNAIKHGKARKINLELVVREGAIVLGITDDGRGMPLSLIERIRQGFALGDTLPRRITRGMGLQTMQYRARVIGGILTASRREGGGTVITCLLGQESAATPGSSGKTPQRTIRNAARRRHKGTSQPANHSPGSGS